MDLFTAFEYASLIHALSGLFGMYSLLSHTLKALTSHKLFTFIIQGFVVTKVEVIDISASAYRLVNPDFLLRCGIDFRLEAL